MKRITLWLSMMALIVSIGASLAIAQEHAARVNVNTADVEALITLDQIGKTRAQAIVQYRQAHGPFKSIEELTEVKGVGAAILAKNRDKLHLK